MTLRQPSSIYRLYITISPTSPTIIYILSSHFLPNFPPFPLLIVGFPAPSLFLTQIRIRSHPPPAESQLTLYASYSSNTSRRLALGGRDVCLVGKTPDMLRPRIVGMRGSYHMVQWTTVMHEMSTPPPLALPLRCTYIGFSARKVRHFFIPRRLARTHAL